MNTNEAGGTKRGRQDEPTTQDCKRHAQAAAASVSRADGKKQRMGQDVPVLGAASTVSGEGESGDAVRLVAQDAWALATSALFSRGSKIRASCYKSWSVNRRV